MDPCQLNAVITAITNQLYSALEEDDFVCLSIFLNELSKTMLSMAILGDVCRRQGRKQTGRERLRESREKGAETPRGEEERRPRKPEKR